MILQMFRTGLGFLLALGVLACQTKPIRYDEVTEANWRARVLVKDLGKQKSAVLNLQILARWPDRLRIDVFSTLGTHEATLIARETDVELLQVSARKKYVGKASPKFFAAITGVPLEIQEVQELLFDRQLTGPGWTCVRDDRGYLENCESAKRRLTAKWSHRQVHKKSLFLEAPGKSVQLNFVDFSKNLSPGDGDFSVSAPANFQTLPVEKLRL